MTPDQWVALMIARGAELRAAGVSYVSAGDFAAHLEATTPAAADAAGDALQREYAEAIRSPLDDPATFGIQTPRGRVPSYRRPEENPDEE